MANTQDTLTQPSSVFRIIAALWFLCSSCTKPNPQPLSTLRSRLMLATGIPVLAMILCRAKEHLCLICPVPDPTQTTGVSIQTLQTPSHFSPERMKPADPASHSITKTRGVYHEFVTYRLERVSYVSDGSCVITSEWMWQTLDETLNSLIPTLSSVLLLWWVLCSQVQFLLMSKHKVVMCSASVLFVLGREEQAFSCFANRMRLLYEVSIFFFFFYIKFE